MLIDKELQLTDDPFQSFLTWYEAAGNSDPQPDAMTLATVNDAGRPSLRMVLYRGMSGGGLRFFTNYGSRKARELEGNSQGSLLFYWQSLRRQVRIEGRVERLSGQESDAYFAGRDRESQLSAWASRQGEPIASRELLRQAVDKARERFGEKEVPRPEFWGGFRLLPDRFEFWRNRDNRLHDRFCYEPDGTRGPDDPAGTAWRVTRLSP